MKSVTTNIAMAQNGLACTGVPLRNYSFTQCSQTNGHKYQTHLKTCMRAFHVNLKKTRQIYPLHKPDIRE